MTGAAPRSDLRHGSVRVRAGRQVATGELLGEVGHTGNSTAPHLHFQLMTSADPTDAVGLPCGFRRYERRKDGTWVLERDAVPSGDDVIRCAA